MGHLCRSCIISMEEKDQLTGLVAILSYILRGILRLLEKDSSKQEC